MSLNNIKYTYPQELQEIRKDRYSYIKVLHFTEYQYTSVAAIWRFAMNLNI
jgi:hypothetical protein